mmetsp:Transcript_88107/g.282719  ORF Transcript_88107/g.282719 Transcript_88107/m.282719 type:complete len:532 (+) Transcript_88107:865-2460(+)
MRICTKWLAFIAFLEIAYLIYSFRWSTLAVASLRTVENYKLLGQSVQFHDEGRRHVADSPAQALKLGIPIGSSTTAGWKALRNGSTADASVTRKPAVASSRQPSSGGVVDASVAGGAVGGFLDGVEYGGMGGHRGGDCAKFEGVDFPSDPDWGPGVRDKSGASIYGTGWAQQRLHQHQFPSSCDGKEYVEHGMFRSGIGSNIHISAAVLAHALNTGRIYVWPDDDIHNPWTLGKDKKSIVDCPSGKQTRSYECYFKPITSCKSDGKGPRFTGVAKERGKEKIKGADVVPTMFKALLKCSGYPKDYWRKWWRAQAAAFLVRLSPQTGQELATFRSAVLVGDAIDSGAGLSCGTVGTHVRHGDKYYEAPEYPFEDYWNIFQWLAGSPSADFLKRCPSSPQLVEPFRRFLPAIASKRLYVGTDDPKVQELAISTASGWSLTYMNVTRVQKRMQLMDLRALLGAKEAVMESLLNLHLLLEADALICTWTSNWCRLVDELRMTVAMKANHLSLEINKHCPRFNWVFGQGKGTPDFR